VSDNQYSNLLISKLMGFWVLSRKTYQVG